MSKKILESAKTKPQKRPMPTTKLGKTGPAKHALKTRNYSKSNAVVKRLPEDRKFRQVLSAGLVLFFGISLVVPFISVPEKSREELEKLPPQLTQFVLKEKRKPQPQPKPLRKVEEQKPKIEKKHPTPKKVQVAQPKSKPVAPPPKVAEQPMPKVVKRETKRVIKATEQQRAVAKAQAQKSGILAMQAGLSSLVARDIAPKQAKTIGKVNKNSRAQTGSAIAVASGGASGGSAASQVVGATIDGVAVQHTTMDLGGVQTGQVLANASGSNGNDAQPPRQGQRDESAIRKVFERNKAAIYSIYARAQRKNEDLAGKLVLEIKIGADGRVDSLKLIDSELEDKKLERRIMTRVKMFTFGQENVASLTMRYTFDFVAS